MMNEISLSCIILGDSGCGKSTLLQQLVSPQQSGIYDMVNGPTIGVDFSIHRFEINNTTRMKLKLWDTAGQERFNSVTAQYIRNNCIVYCVYDISEHSTFTNIIKRWLPLAKDRLHTNTKFVLLGNKCDRRATREVAYDVAQTFAHKHNMYFAEVSSRDHETTVNSAFMLPIASLVHDIQTNIIGKNLYTKLGIVTLQTRQTQSPTCCRIV